MQQQNYMTPHEVATSKAVGNRIARKIANGKRINANAAIRHQIATRGIVAASAFACELLGMNHADACKHVAALMNSKPDDIVSPHFK